MNGLIGIGCTTHNRGDIARYTFNKLIQFSPPIFKLVVVDDASYNPFEGATYRFNENVGISVSKNKCLELLDDCDHIFVFDDDFYPVAPEWYLPYVNSGLQHACYTFDRMLLAEHDRYNEFEKPNGVMMYFTRNCIDAIGGWDTDFQIYGYEHVNLSDRIFNYGLTPARYIDVVGAHHMFHSFDKTGEIESSVDPLRRGQGILHNTELYLDRYFSKEFKAYK